MDEVHPVILCGGAGTRLWPLSREALPKQFHRIAGSETLFQQTCRRMRNDLFDEPSVLACQHHRFLIAEQLAEIGVKARNIVLEPVAKNTGPAACIAALIAAKDDPKSLLLLAPSDHVIEDAASFANAIEAGTRPAKDGALVVFGIEPDCPHTGYGYIETAKGNLPSRKVNCFVEKPSREAAEAFLGSGNHYWNAGLFLSRADILIELFALHAPAILEACRLSLEEVTEDLGFMQLNGAYTQAPSISLDYAVAEKAANLCCVPLNAPWSDVGSWSAVWDLLEKDAKGNVRIGDGEVVFEQTTNSLAFSDKSCLALVGVENLVVVATEDAVLVASKDYAESVRSIVEYLKANGGTHALEHVRVYRPWGWYEIVNRGERYQVKCIMVKPGGKLSLQRHHHRAEHWVVVKGTLEVTKGRKTQLLSENQSTYIPVGKPHRLANPGKLPAFFIEVQSGAYLDEDDIVRFNDVYGRDAGA